MTEEEWLRHWSYDAMYKAVRGRASTRQARLYMVACCRLLADQFFDSRIPLVLEAAERCADDPCAEAVVTALWEEWVTSRQPCLPLSGPEGELDRAISAAWQLVSEVPNEPTSDRRYSNAQAAIASAVLM